jgi:ferritin-like metal-binding protein YciE
MKLKAIDDLYLHGLKDIYYTEKQLVKTLPKMAKKAAAAELKKAFEDHLKETEGHVERLEQIFESLDKPARGEKCEAIAGLIKEGQEVIENAEEDGVLDAGLLAAAQAVEHYEIARYGTLCAWAKQMGRDEDIELLQATLEEEKAADELLSSIAEATVNQRAAA